MDAERPLVAKLWIDKPRDVSSGNGTVQDNRSLATHHPHLTAIEPFVVCRRHLEDQLLLLAITCGLKGYQVLAIRRRIFSDGRQLIPSGSM